MWRLVLLPPLIFVQRTKPRDHTDGARGHYIQGKYTAYNQDNQKIYRHFARDSVDMPPGRGSGTYGPHIMKNMFGMVFGVGEQPTCPVLRSNWFLLILVPNPSPGTGLLVASIDDCQTPSLEPDRDVLKTSPRHRRLRRHLQYTTQVFIYIIGISIV